MWDSVDRNARPGPAASLLPPALSALTLGFYSDELYYIACAGRPALGYVDHPPFSVIVLRLWMELFGDSLLVVRVLPAAAGAATAFLAGWMAGRLEDRRTRMLRAQGSIP
ncbi:MAG: hypothetical protein JRG92_16340 [Deltaproteobacteria bacterium]|nr:hypothetical protein [Deltaproteobacteria bacterium]MBW2697770.1 hypothetical protein [Deltaproteobacteria bacterium]